MIGSIRLARRAGIQTASNATSVNTTGIPTNTTGSRAVTPNRNVAITRARPNAAATPLVDGRSSAIVKLPGSMVSVGVGVGRTGNGVPVAEGVGVAGPWP